MLERKMPKKLIRLLYRLKLKHIFLLVFTIWVLDYFGAFTHVFELSYDENFRYPYDGDVHTLVQSLKHRKKPEVDPINDYNYTYIHPRVDFCADEGNDFRSLRLVFLVKSSAPHFDRRVAIRNTWGFKKRFFDVPTRTIFLLGIHENDQELQRRIDDESAKFKDILQGNFIDSYYNNTIKTMLGFKWAFNHCRTSKFYMFVDDDMYVSVKNVLRFIRNPVHYPEYLKDPSKLVKREIKDSDLESLTDSSIPPKNPMEETANEKIEPRSKLLSEDAKMEEAEEASSNLDMKKEGDLHIGLDWTSPNENSMMDTKKLHQIATSKLVKGGTIDKKAEMLSRNDEDEAGETKKSDGNLKNLMKKSLMKQMEPSKLHNLKEAETISTKDSQNFAVRGKRATAKEKILMRKRPGWKSHDKTKMPPKPDEASEISDAILPEKLKVFRQKRATAKEKILIRKRPGWKNHNKTTMPGRIEPLEVEETLAPSNKSTGYQKLTRGRRQVFDFELPDDVKLFAGYVFVSAPHRHKTSKWYVTLEEYPFHLWPPYVTAGAYVLSKSALVDMYLTSLYTQHFKFDDVFLGLVAKKADIEPFHCDEFHFYKKDYTKFNYKYVISSHGYGNPEELVAIWNEQKSMGNA